MTEYDEQPLGRMIYYMAQDIKNLAERILAPYDLTLEQFQSLKALTRNNAMPQRELCQEIKKNPANMTRILDRLEGKSLISRQPDPNDRRAYLVLLTSKGRLLFDEVEDVFEQFSAEVHKGLTPDLRRITRKAFDIMAANVERMSAILKKDEKR